MQREGRVDAQRRRGVLRQRAAGGGEVGIADRRRGAEPVEAAAQDHQRRGGCCRVRRRRRGSSVGQAARLPVTAAAVAKRRRRAGLCSGRSWRWRGLRFMACSSAAQRRWNSGASSSRASACEPSAARSIWRAVSAPSRGPRLSAREAPRVDAAAGAVGDAGRPLDPLPDRVGTEPVFAAIAPAGRRRRRHHPLAEREHGAGGVDLGPLEHALAGGEQARRRDDELLGRLQLRRRRAPGRLVVDQLAVERRRAGRRSSGRPRPAGRPAPAAARRRRSGAPAWWRRSGRWPDGGPGRGAARAAPRGLRGSSCRARSSGPARASCGSNGCRRRPGRGRPASRSGRRRRRSRRPGV